MLLPHHLTLLSHPTLNIFFPLPSPFTLSSSPTSTPADIILPQKPPAEFPLEEENEEEGEESTTPNNNAYQEQQGEDLIYGPPYSGYIEPAKTTTYTGRVEEYV